MDIVALWVDLVKLVCEMTKKKERTKNNSNRKEITKSLRFFPASFSFTWAPRSAYRYSTTAVQQYTCFCADCFYFETVAVTECAAMLTATVSK